MFFFDHGWHTFIVNVWPHAIYGSVDLMDFITGERFGKGRREWNGSYFPILTEELIKEHQEKITVKITG